MKDVTKHENLIVWLWLNVCSPAKWAAVYPSSKLVCLDFFFQPKFKTIYHKFEKWMDDSIWLCIYNFVCSVNLLCCLFSYHLTLSLRKCPRSSKSHTSSQSRRWFLCAVGFELWPPSPIFAHLPSFPQAWLYWLIENISAL